MVLEYVIYLSDAKLRDKVADEKQSKQIIQAKNRTKHISHNTRETFCFESRTEKKTA